MDRGAWWATIQGVTKKLDMTEHGRKHSEKWESHESRWRRRLFLLRLETWNVSPYHPKGQDLVDYRPGFVSEFIKLSEPADTSLPWELDIIPEENEI